jgi:hypothetical protein
VDSPSSVIALKVFHKPIGFGKKKCLAKKEMKIAQLLEKDEKDEAPKGEPTFVLIAPRLMRES